MTQIVSRGTSVLGTSNTTWANLPNAYDGVPPAVGGTWAQWTNSVSDAVGYIEITGYHTAFAAIPNGSTITSVSIKVQSHLNNSTRYVSLTFQPFDGATPIGTPAAGTLQGTSHADTATFTPTLAQLKSSGFKCRVTWTRATVVTSGIASLDSVDVIVDYTGVSVGGRPKVYVAGSFQQKPGKVWNGSAWVEKPFKTWTGSAWKTLT